MSQNNAKHLFAIGRRYRWWNWWGAALMCVAYGLAMPGDAQAQSETVLHSFAAPAKGSGPIGLLRSASGTMFGTAYEGGAHGWGVVYELTAAAKQKVLYNFTGGADGGLPYSPVTRDSGGNLYGTTYSGGASGKGVVYKVTLSGEESVLYSFTGGADGANPIAGVILDPEDNLYGTTWLGGTGFGVVFKLTPSGQETVLYSFTGFSDGGVPAGGVVRDRSGNLYGATSFYGSGSGVVYKIKASGAFSVIYTFTGGQDGGFPSMGLIRDSADNLYGATQQGGADNFGVVFKLTPSGQETVLNSFTGGFGGSYPDSLVEDSSGNFWGTTGQGGANNVGVIFEIPAVGITQVLYSLNGGPAGPGTPGGALALDSEGNLYGTTVSGGTGNQGVVYKFVPTAGQVDTVYNFPSRGDGAFPEYGNLVRDAAGNLYGTTGSGGTSGWGVIYKLHANGAESILHSFTGGEDGGEPQSGLIRDSSGNLYGTTSYGAGNFGTVFKLSAAGEFTTLHSFSGRTDGGNPQGYLALDTEGNLYGSTIYDGADGQGVIFEINNFDQFSVLYTFTGGADGGLPFAGVTVDAAGNLYGTTIAGGEYGWGVVFKLIPGGPETVLYNFPLNYQIGSPWSNVVLDAQGNLYGTTDGAGNLNDYGAVYSLTQSGAFTALHMFAGGQDGCNPISGVTRDSSGNLYGATQSCGSLGHGVVYEVNPGGAETILHTFSGGADGLSPVSGITLDIEGNVYGTTTRGGDENAGVVYKVAP